MPSASRWLNSANLLKPHQRYDATIIDFEMIETTGGEKKIALKLSRWPQKLLLNEPNRIMIAAGYGDEPKDWIGAPVEVWTDNVMFQDKPISSIKVTPAPHY